MWEGIFLAVLLIGIAVGNYWVFSNYNKKIQGYEQAEKARYERLLAMHDAVELEIDRHHLRPILERERKGPVVSGLYWGGALSIIENLLGITPDDQTPAMILLNRNKNREAKKALIDSTTPTVAALPVKEEQ